MKTKILQAAITEAELNHYSNIRREKVAARAGCPKSSINYHFGSMIILKNAVTTDALESNNFTILAQMIIAKHWQIVPLSYDQKLQILLTFL